MLVAVGEGRLQSVHVHPRSISSAVVEAMKRAREQLDCFVDLPGAELPRDPEANARYGDGRS